jgi:hypothetical protein
VAKRCKNVSNLIVLPLGLLVLSCGDDGGPSVVAQVRISAPTEIIVLNEQIPLAVQVHDSEGRLIGDRAVNWTSSRPAVAPVHEAGAATTVPVATAPAVTGISPGKTEIVATVDNVSGRKEIWVTHDIEGRWVISASGRKETNNALCTVEDRVIDIEVVQRVVSVVIADAVISSIRSRFSSFGSVSCEDSDPPPDFGLSKIKGTIGPPTYRDDVSMLWGYEYPDKYHYQHVTGSISTDGRMEGTLVFTVLWKRCSFCPGPIPWVYDWVAIKQ